MSKPALRKSVSKKPQGSREGSEFYLLEAFRSNPQLFLERLREGLYQNGELDGPITERSEMLARLADVVELHPELRGTALHARVLFEHATLSDNYETWPLSYAERAAHAADVAETAHAEGDCERWWYAASAAERYLRHGKSEQALTYFRKAAKNCVHCPARIISLNLYEFAHYNRNVAELTSDPKERARCLKAAESYLKQDQDGQRALAGGAA